MNKGKGVKKSNVSESKGSDSLSYEPEYPNVLKRIDGRYILSEIASILNFDKGIFFSVKEILIRPGNSVRNYLHADRNRLVKPITFIIVCSLVYTVFKQYLEFGMFFEHFLDGYNETSGIENSVLVSLFEWVQMNFGYANILMSVFVASWVKLLYKKYEYNFFEVLILLFYVLGIGTLIYTVFGIAESLSQYDVLFIGAISSYIYTSWAIGQFFNRTKTVSYLKGTIAYLLGFLTFYFVVIISGTVGDFIKLFLQETG